MVACKFNTVSYPCWRLPPDHFSYWQIPRFSQNFWMYLQSVPGIIRYCWVPDFPVFNRQSKITTTKLMLWRHDLVLSGFVLFLVCLVFPGTSKLHSETGCFAKKFRFWSGKSNKFFLNFFILGQRPRAFSDPELFATQTSESEKKAIKDCFTLI